MPEKASDLFVRALESEGVEYIFAVPGEENLDLIESLHKSSIKLVVTRHEQGAGFMAATYGRLTGKAGVCLSTLGPGATNLTTPAAYAQLGGFPLIIITGQKPIKKSKQARFQVIDIVSLFTPICKMSTQIVHGNTIPNIVRESFRIAEEEKPGAVMIELPEDIASETTEASILERHERYYAVANKHSIEEAAQAINKAKSPLLLLGAAASRHHIYPAIAELIDKTHIPFFTTQMGKGVIDERSPHFLGTAALSDGDYIHCAVDASDLIICVGHDIVEKPPFLMSKNGPKVIHINYKSTIVDPMYFPHITVVGDVCASIRALTQRLMPHNDNRQHTTKKMRAFIDHHLQQQSSSSAFPFTPQRLVSDIRAVLADDDILTLDNGMYKIWFARHYRAHAPNTILLDNTLATMGAGLSSGLMASMLYPKKRVLAICGDGGFMMNSQEIETAIRLKANLVIGIINDAAYGMIRWKQKSMKFTDWGLSFSNPDFVAYAKSYGATGHRLRCAADLQTTLTNAFDMGGVHIIDIPIDYRENTTLLKKVSAKEYSV